MRDSNRVTVGKKATGFAPSSLVRRVATPARLLENTRPRLEGLTHAMNLHEYQSKDVFRKFGIPVPPGKIATSVDEAAAAAEAIGGPVWVVKAQVHAAGLAAASRW